MQRGKDRRAALRPSMQERELKRIFLLAKANGKSIPNPNNVIYRGPQHPWYKARMKHVDSGKILPFSGIGFTAKAARRDLYKQIKNAGWSGEMSESRVTVDQATGRKHSVTRALYTVEFAPMDAMLPRKLAKTYPQYGRPWHSGRTWRKQEIQAAKDRRRKKVRR